MVAFQRVSGWCELISENIVPLSLLIIFINDYEK